MHSAQLRQLLAGPDLILAPGVADAFTAKVAARVGFPVLFSTGAGIANTLLGEPDVGLTTMTEVVAVTRRIADAVELPVIADADTGYGNHLNVTRTIREFERAGVAGLFIEDQVAPKRCGHFANKQVVPTEEMVQKIVAARAARTDPDLVLIARTDAIACEGLEAAFARADAYVAAGADVIFIEAPTSVEQLAAIPKRVDAPTMVNLVEGGLTPLLPASELAEMGFRIAVYANLALRAAGWSARRALTELYQRGTSQKLLGEILEWDERQELVGLPQWEILDRKILSETQEIMSTLPRVTR